jgi:hypothetical protein
MSQAIKINGISIPNTSITGYTYDGVNTFTITQNDGVSFTATIDELYASVISGGTLYGDGSNITGIVTTDNYVTGGTLDGNSIQIGRTDSSGILIISGGTNVTITEPTTGVFRIDSPDTTGGGGSLTGDTVTLDFTLDGTYVTSSATFAEVPINVIIQSATTYNSDFSTINGTLICDISQSDAGTAGEFDLYNLTDGTTVSGSATAFTSTDGLKSSSSFSITNIHFDDTFRVRVRRTGTPGSANMRIRGAQLILSLT